MFEDFFKLAGGRWNPNLAPDVIQGSSLGGLQSSQGWISIFGYKMEYASGSFVDMVTESFAGPHDMANDHWFYSPTGFIKEMSEQKAFVLDLATNYTTSLVFAAPFAAGAMYEQLHLGVYGR